mmetsp:Transcript_25803/g.45489  ORF Transcript_25803/g.45489 Transcript_25803/m.45489 type:complete len:281 (-) Transcript_25803:497-1339(-)
MVKLKSFDKIDADLEELIQGNFCSETVLSVALDSWSSDNAKLKFEIAQKPDSPLTAKQTLKISTPQADLSIKADSAASLSLKSVFRVNDAWNVKGEFDLWDRSSSSFLVGLLGEVFHSRLRLHMTPELSLDVLSGTDRYGVGACLGYNFSKQVWSHLDFGAYFAHNHHKAVLKLNASKDIGELKIAGRYKPDAERLTLGAELVYHLYNNSANFSFVTLQKLDPFRTLKFKLCSTGLISGSLMHSISENSSIVTAFGLQAHNVSSLTAKDLNLSMRLIFGQ